MSQPKLKAEYVSERAVRDAGMKHFKALESSIWFSVQQTSIKGSPDNSGVVRGYAFYIEWKKNKKAKRSKLQEHNLQRIRRAGGYAFFCYPENFEYVYDIALRLSKGEKIDPDTIKDLSE